MNKKRPKKSTLGNVNKHSSSPTPGPYGIREKSSGCEVYGKDGIGIAWFGENGHYNLGDPTKSHTISKEEAQTNAKLLLSALEATEQVQVICQAECDELENMLHGPSLVRQILPARPVKKGRKKS